MFNRIRHVKIFRRGYEITLPKDTYLEIENKGYNISLILNNKKEPSCVQITNKNKYLGTLKTRLGVIGFKNNNVCDFHKKNVIK